jgi:hypothetical protein
MCALAARVGHGRACPGHLQLAERLTMALMDRLPADSTRGRQNAEFIPLITSSLVDLGLLVQNHVQQGTVDFNVTVVINKTQFPKSVHEKAHARSRPEVAPEIWTGR